MGKFEKGLIALVLLLFGGIGLMLFPTGKSDENSSEVLDTSEYQKVVESAKPKDRKLRVELTAKATTADKQFKIRGNVIKSGATTQLKQLLKKQTNKDVSFKLGAKKGIFVSTKKFTLKTDDNLQTVASAGEIGYDPTSKKLLIFGKNVNYESGFISMGHLRGIDQSQACTTPNLLELSFDD
ncbi:hypothetical protein [Lactobacillus sp.]|uniref:hypothetical protein n=1 Tax=Lactobacillus sp. TaxID=1591 RepID=UPI003EF47668